MKKVLLIALIAVIGVFSVGCKKEMSEEDFEAIKKEVIGAYILDVFSLTQEAAEWTEEEGEAKRDSIVDYEIDAVAKDHGFRGKDFVAKAEVLERNAKDEIDDESEDLALEIAGGLITEGMEMAFDPENWEKPEEEIEAMMEELKWELVDEALTEGGYLPTDYEARLKAAKGE